MGGESCGSDEGGVALMGPRVVEIGDGAEAGNNWVVMDPEGTVWGEGSTWCNGYWTGLREQCRRLSGVDRDLGEGVLVCREGGGVLKVLGLGG